MDFIYHKYDRLNRLIESGEYEVSGSSSEFTQVNADDPDFPSGSGVRVSREFSYDDPESGDPGSGGQQYTAGRLSCAKVVRDNQEITAAWYSYDARGRIRRISRTGLGFGARHVEMDYDRQNHPVKLTYKDSSNEVSLHYSYDDYGRLIKVESDFSGSLQTEAEYTYFPTGRLKQKKLGSLAQAVDYRYNTRDWVVAINKYDRSSFDNFSGRPENLFGIELGYERTNHVANYVSPQTLHNGNVSWTTWSLKDVEVNSANWGSTERIGQVYAYDHAGRLKDANTGLDFTDFFDQTNQFRVTGITYDKAGNFTAVKRYDDQGEVMDDYAYKYYSGSHRLERIEDNEGYGENNQPEENYTYDANGNILRDKAAGIGFILYDIFNNPVRYYTENGGQFNCSYDHEGRRIKRFDGTHTCYYNYDTKGRLLATANASSSVMLYNVLGLENEGQYRHQSGASDYRNYYLKDHLGSIRMFSDENGNRAGWSDYYPFGMKMPGRTGSDAPVDKRFRFTGKERDAMTGYDYFGARYYDPRIGRFLSVDPEAGEYPGVSPYVYVLNNPLRLVDPDGKRATENIWWPQTLEEVDDIEELPLVIGDEIVVTAEAPKEHEQIDFLDYLSVTNTLAGLGAGGAGLIAGLPGQRRFRHEIGRRSYLSYSSRYAPLPLANVARTVSRGTFAGSLIIAGIEISQDQSTSQVAESGFDVTASGIATYGPRLLGVSAGWGLAISVLYFGGKIIYRLPESESEVPRISPGLSPTP